MKNRAYASDDVLVTNYEYKQFDITNHEGFVTLSATVGRTNDEGTLAAVFARQHRHIVIGLKGGLKLLNAKNPNQAKGLHNVLYAERSY